MKWTRVTADYPPRLPMPVYILSYKLGMGLYYPSYYVDVE